VSGIDRSCTAKCSHKPGIRITPNPKPVMEEAFGLVVYGLLSLSTLGSGDVQDVSKSLDLNKPWVVLID